MTEKLFRKLRKKIIAVKPSEWKRSDIEYSANIGGFKVVLSEETESQVDMAGENNYWEVYILEVYEDKTLIVRYDDREFEVDTLYEDIEKKVQKYKEQVSREQKRRSLKSLRSILDKD